jgi:hypothetical protein
MEKRKRNKAQKEGYGLTYCLGLTVWVNTINSTCIRTMINIFFIDKYLYLTFWMHEYM